ncbi:MAG: hypothetical protein U0X75_04305 [Acidobacteriota bacterium]
MASLIGRPLANAPKHTTGLFTRYNFLESTGIGFGLESASERIEPFAGIRADGYTIADVSFYQELTSAGRGCNCKSRTSPTRNTPPVRCLRRAWAIFRDNHAP